MTADAACKGIRDFDPDGAITVVAEEPHPPYARPPLSKALWKGDEESTIWRGTADLGVELRLGRTIVALDLEGRRATDDRGETYAYERLLLATGGRPRRLPFGGDEVIYFRTLDDYRRLRALADEEARFLVIGGGFIGSEIAAALAMNARSVTMVFPEPGIGARIFPAELSESVTDYYRAQGVEVLARASVTAIERDGCKVRLATGDGRTLEADAVVAGLGIEPRVELAASAGLPVTDGIVVDDRGRVDGHERVFAAGDVARFPEAALGGARRVEHEDHAKSHGRRVGANMALQTIADLSELGGESTVYYLDNEGRPRGVLLWNLFGRVDAARELIRAGDPVEPGALLERVG
jgi:NADPH-dependent 2,4-dienoyl-CoA reductase/sulfur reductase-like enzyme